jgi:hypothetical protein
VLKAQNMPVHGNGLQLQQKSWKASHLRATKILLKHKITMILSKTV